VLGLCIVGFSLGVVIIAFGAQTWQRLRLRYFGSFTLQFAGSTLILLAEGFRTYGDVTQGALNPALPGVITIVVTAGHAVLGWSLPLFALDLTGVRVTARRRVVHLLIVAVLTGTSLLAELVPGALTYAVDYLAIIALYGYGTLILLRGLGKIEDARLRTLTTRLLVLAASTALPGLAQLAVRFIPQAPAWLRGYPLVQLVYYLGTVGLLLAHTARPVSAESAAQGCSLPPGFIQRYSISPRECEIISSLEQGISNKRLAEQLFISAQTVKNHIYHIYQKTGARNKVQLVNLVRTFQSLENPVPANRGGEAAEIPSK
jgi:DNA-binding CsgD family transcriptional regulator